MQRKSRNGRGGPRPGSGRPPLSPEERLSERVTVNLTKDERAALRRVAGDEREGAYLRRLLVRHLSRRR
jgi:hypothetical protein